ncbi:amino acid ABC transporter permease [Aeromonas veronii]|uniref:amino acid ABC transporter permease n=1 Tax=Aeromonas veronii TaxID=654 RepID=UPI00187F4308|nr:amino acid ABC transporter permease [Aeromonas veronii]MBE8734051.1 amino acid ABC transporter permease [Aeromonas veronii]MBE8741271.1 amino acid ABC transporter permease [Aeromonas veronii]MBE8742037.1 amino acid ABC transporter permease [Aeromonas veronii]MBE8765655.1 amino acid ABC transporter permease [Aeromonas veronii]MBE8837999.1 amino acid ABC transporter permease [Aeromonas veronii]
MARLNRPRLLGWLSGTVMLSALLGWALYSGARQMGYEWQWPRVLPFLGEWDEGTFYAGPLLNGLLVTLQVALLSLLGTMAVGVCVVSLRLLPSRLGPWLAIAYLALVRTTPQLVQIYILYFLLGPMLGLAPLACAVLSLSLYQGAFTAEVLRAGVQAIPKGQWEAAHSLGLSRTITLRKVILPQLVRITLPPLTNELVSLIKHSALVSVIAIFDLTNEGRTLVADTFLTFEVWFTVAALYLLLTLTLSACSRALARHLNPDQQGR